MGTQRFLLAPGWEEGVPLLAGALKDGWDPFDAAQGWVFLKAWCITGALLYLSGSHYGLETTIKMKGITDYSISKGEEAGYQLCLK